MNLMFCTVHTLLQKQLSLYLSYTGTFFQQEGFVQTCIKFQIFSNAFVSYVGFNERDIICKEKQYMTFSYTAFRCQKVFRYIYCEVSSEFKVGLSAPICIMFLARIT
jgi:hypothetical protein